MTFIPRLADAKDDPDLKGEALRVYLHLIYDLSPVDYRPVKQIALASKLHVSLRTIEDAMAQLIRRGYIQAGTRVPGSPQVYRLVYSQKVA